jgi:hypothetical protein
MPVPSSCTASFPAGDVISKNMYMASQLGQGIFQGDYAGSYGPSGITNGVITAAQLGAELLQ